MLAFAYYMYNASDICILFSFNDSKHKNVCFAQRMESEMHTQIVKREKMSERASEWERG